MVDIKKVMKGLQCLARTREPTSNPCADCGYIDRPNFAMCVVDVAIDALDLLKEQEAKPMTEYDDGWDCPRCGLKLVGKTASGYPCDELDLPNDEIVKYCPVCGQAVKLE